MRVNVTREPRCLVGCEKLQHLLAFSRKSVSFFENPISRSPRTSLTAPCWRDLVGCSQFSVSVSMLAPFSLFSCSHFKEIFCFFTKRRQMRRTSPKLRFRLKNVSHQSENKTEQFLTICGWTGAKDVDSIDVVNTCGRFMCLSPLPARLARKCLGLHVQ